MRPGFSPLRHVTSHLLPNGLRVLLKEERSWPLVSVQSWVRVGSLDEEDPQAGISHVIEHMVFKGTRLHSAEATSRWVESLGGNLNAETTKEYTHYYIDIPKEGAADAVRLMAEMLYEATFHPAEWERECPVILEEMKRRHDDPDVLVWDLVNEAIFHNHRIGRSVIGSPETVRAMTRENLWSFYRRFYTADRTLLVVAGDFDSRSMIETIQKAWSAMPRGGNIGRDVAVLPPYIPRHVSARKPVQQSYLAFGFPTPPAVHADHEPLDLLASLLGDGRNSRLVSTLREEKKLAWSVSASNLTQEGPGMFAIFVECDPARRKRLTSALQKCLDDLRWHKPSRAEWSRAKNILHTSWLQSFETVHNQASMIGLYALEGHLERLEHYLPRLMALTPSQMQTIIDRYLESLPFSSAVVEG